MAKQAKSKQKKMNVRVDFTPMVDMMMLLITFFMLCTSLAKPQTMELSMPSNDKNQTDEDKSVAKASYTITMYVGANNQIYYVAGIPKYDDPTCLKKTKAKLDEKKVQNPNMPDSIYNKELSKIKGGEIDGQKISTMTIIIKATDQAAYQNVIDALDEMQLCSIGKYVIDKINPDDQKLLDKAGVK